jgi:hypothetical protein
MAMMLPQSQMPAMTQNQGLMGSLFNPAYGINGSLWNNQPQNPNGAAPQQASANPMAPAQNPNGGLPPNPAAQTQPQASMNTMGQPGSPAPAPTPGTNPAIPAPQAAGANQTKAVNQGNMQQTSAIPQPGKTSTGQKSGSLNDIAMQIMSDGALGGSGGGAGGIMGMM